MGIFNQTLSIEQLLLKIDQEITRLKWQRGTLLSRPDTPDSQLKLVYLSLELKKLERLFVGRERIAQLKASAEPGKTSLPYIQHLGKMDTVNERCIQLMIKRLFEEGYGADLKRHGFLTTSTELVTPPIPLNGKIALSVPFHQTRGGSI